MAPRKTKPVYELPGQLPPMMEELGREVNIEDRECVHCRRTRNSYRPTNYCREGLEMAWPIEVARPSEVLACPCACHDTWRMFNGR